MAVIRCRCAQSVLRFDLDKRQRLRHTPDELSENLRPKDNSSRQRAVRPPVRANVNAQVLSNHVFERHTWHHAAMSHLPHTASSGPQDSGFRHFRVQESAGTCGSSFCMPKDCKRHSCMVSCPPSGHHTTV
jgi:hypothetical protein